MRSASVRLLLFLANTLVAKALSVATASPTDASTLNVPKPWMPAVVAASNAAAQRCLAENGLLCVRGALSTPTAEAALEHVNKALAEALRDDDPTKHFCPVIYGTGDCVGRHAASRFNARPDAPAGAEGVRRDPRVLISDLMQPAR